MSCRSRRMVDFASLPGAMSVSHRSMYFCQRELLDGLRRVAAVTFKEDSLFVEPLFDLLGRQFLRWVDGFLLGLDALAVVVISQRF